MFERRTLVSLDYKDAKKKVRKEKKKNGMKENKNK